MANSTTQFGGFLTNVGVALQANSAALGLPWSITHMLIGDAGGEPSQTPDPTPNPAQSALVRRVYRAPLNALYKSPADPNVLVAELVLPPEIGGWWIRELGLEDADGNFIAVAKPPPSYKPLLQQGSGRTQTIRMHVVFGNVANINLKIDPSIVLATRDYVDKAREAAELYARNQLKAHTDAADPHPQYLRRADVAKDAGPLAWLGAAAGTADALVLTLKSSEAALPAYAAGQRFQFQAVATNTGAVTAKINGRPVVAVKKSGSSGLVDLAGGDIQAGALYDLNYDGAYFQLGGGVGGSSLPVGSIVPFPKDAVPPGFLELDGSTKSAAMYPDLAAYLGTTFNKGDEGAGYFRLPESRGEFLRGWDHGRGVDAGRVLGSFQKGSLQAYDPNRTSYSVTGLTHTGDDTGILGKHGLDPAALADYPQSQVVSHDNTNITAINVAGGVSRPRNLAVMWCIKAWSAPVNQGNIDVAALAAQVAVAVPKDYRRGLGMAVNAAAPTTTIDVLPGIARGTGTPVELSNTMSGVLQAAGAWSAEFGGNKLDAGVRASNSWYHVFMLRKISNSQADLLFSLSLSAPAVPAGYEAVRRIGSLKTNSSGLITPFYQIANRFYWTTPAADVYATLAASTAYSYVVSVPPGVPVIAMLNYSTSGQNALVYISGTGADALIPSGSTAVGYGAYSSAAPEGGSGYLEVPLGPQGQVSCVANVIYGVVFSLFALGWIDNF